MGPSSPLSPEGADRGSFQEPRDPPDTAPTTRLSTGTVAQPGQPQTPSCGVGRQTEAEGARHRDCGQPSGESGPRAGHGGGATAGGAQTPRVAETIDESRIARTVPGVEDEADQPQPTSPAGHASTSRANARRISWAQAQPCPDGRLPGTSAGGGSIRAASAPTSVG